MKYLFENKHVDTDYSEKIPKPMRKAVPAGAVYYFRLVQGSLEELKDIFHFKSIST